MPGPSPPFQFAGEVAALATAACWVVTGFAFEMAGRRIGSMAVNLIRLIMAAGILSLWTWAVRGLPLPVDATPRAWAWLALSGVVGFTIGDLCLFRAFVLIGTRLSMLLMALVPPLTAVVGFVVLGETLSMLDVAGMSLTVTGVAWVVAERRPPVPGEAPRRGGILLGLGGALGQAVGLVLSKLGMGEYDAFAATQIRVYAGIVGFVVLFTAIGWWPRVASAFGDHRAMAHTGLGAFFGPFLGVSLSLVAVKYTATGVAATLIALVPVLVIPPAIFVLGEKVSLRAGIGAMIAVAGSTLLFL
jgi:drug/metabolite transporter (DMT)-like permease